MDSRLPGELEFPLDRRIGKTTAKALEKHLGLKTVGTCSTTFRAATWNAAS